MNTNYTRYTDDILQSAIDKAMHKVNTPSGSLVSQFHYPNTFSLEAPDRLMVARDLLARLIAAAREVQPAAVGEIAPNWEVRFRVAQRRAEQLLSEVAKAEAELTRIIAAAHEAGWNGVENSKDLAQFIKDQAETLEKWSERIHPDDNDRIVKGVQDRAKAAIAEARQEVTQLRPISEAGLVPEGCVRVYTCALDGWKASAYQIVADTHFADIRLPAPERTAGQKADDSSALGTPVNTILADIRKADPSPFVTATTLTSGSTTNLGLFVPVC